MSSKIAPVAHPSGALRVGRNLPPTDPRVRGLLLLNEWESTNTMTICGPHGHVTVSDKCLAQGYEEGRAFVVALVGAADNAWKEAARRALPQKQNASGLTEGQ